MSYNEKLEQQKASAENSSIAHDTQFVRSNVKKSILILAVLFVFLVAISLYFETHLTQFSEWFVRSTPLGLLLLFITLNDTIISPIPPDIFLIIVTKGMSYDQSLWYSFLFGIASTFGGCLGWVFGRYILKPVWFGERFAGFLNTYHGRINRYGKVMVALGALTPVPYSMTCWAAGFLKMDFKDFFWVTSLRVLRFLLYFKIIYFSEKFSIWINSLF